MFLRLLVASSRLLGVLEWVWTMWTCPQPLRYDLPKQVTATACRCNVKHLTVVHNRAVMTPDTQVDMDI